MHPALLDTLEQMSGTAEPTPCPAARRLSKRGRPRDGRQPRGVGRTGFGNKGVARRSVESQGILDPPEPPHRVGVGREVIGGESMRRDGVK